MKFCPKCGSIMMPKATKGKNQFVCSCGFKQEAEKVVITETVKDKAPELAIIEKEEVINPIVDIDCPKCGNKQAENWEIQTRSADEPATRFFKCTKCRHTWREYK